MTTHPPGVLLTTTATAIVLDTENARIAETTEAEAEVHDPVRMENT